MNRRILLSGVLVLFGSGSTIQSAFSILICLASITLYSIYVPLKDEADNFLQWIAQMQLFLVLLTVLLMKARLGLARSLTLVARPHSCPRSPAPSSSGRLRRGFLRRSDVLGMVACRHDYPRLLRHALDRDH